MKKFDFGAGAPDPGSFPTMDLAEASVRAIHNVGGTLVKYPGSRGYEGLREVAVERFKRRENVEIPKDSIELTTGSMQAIRLIAEYFIDPGDAIITEEYTYSGTLKAFRHYQARIIGIPTDDDGMRTDLLEQLLKELAESGINPKFIYTIDNFQNPTGTVLSLQRRKKMLSLAKEYGIYIIEDDCYGDLRYEGEVVPALYALDSSGMVIYIASFSKILGAGVRLGYFSAAEPLLNQIAGTKIDGGTNVLASCIIAEYLKDNMRSHVEEINAIVKRKRDAMLEALEDNLGNSASYGWTRPPGGLFIWLKLPENTDTAALHTLLNERGVICGAGRSFHYNDEDVKYIRLAFGYPTLDEIKEGIYQLAQSIREAAGG
jgi:2-aminoadipate transaminase